MLIQHAFSRGVAPAAPDAAPIAENRRIHHVDVIRGFALFGVAWMNLYAITDFATPSDRLRQLWTAPLDRVIGFGGQWLMLDKAQTLFGILFGFGFAVFVDRLSERRDDATAVYARRLSALAVFGIAHFVLLWWGDILHDYALVGFVLLLTRRWPGWLLASLGGALMLLAGQLLPLALHLPGGREAGAAISASLAAQRQVAWQALGSGDYRLLLELVRERALLFYTTPFVLTAWPLILGQFLFGAWLHRTGWLQAPERHLPVFRRAAAIGLPIGLALALLRPLRAVLVAAHPHPAGPVLELLEDAALPVLASGYASLLVLAGCRPGGQERLRGLAAFGRMALTNYVLQSVFYVLVLDGFGLGLIGHVGQAADFGLALALAGLQVAFSLWWLKRYRFGPLEWLWRSVTYRSWQTLRRQAA